MLAGYQITNICGEKVKPQKSKTGNFWNDSELNEIEFYKNYIQIMKDFYIIKPIEL